MTTFRHQRGRAVRFFLPISSHIRVGKMPETNLEKDYLDMQVSFWIVLPKYKTMCDPKIVTEYFLTCKIFEQF